MEVLFTILLFLPLIGILWFANMALQRRTAPQISAPDGQPVTEIPHTDPGRGWAFATYLCLAGFYGLLIAFGALIQLLGVAASGPAAATLGESYREMGLDPAAFSTMGLGMWLPAIFGIVLLLRPVRNAVGRVISTFDPASPVHAVALSYIALVFINLLMTLGMGLGNLAQIMEQAGPTDLVPGLWAQEIIMALMALIGAGWLARRGLSQTLKRLAIVRPTLKQTLSGVAIGVTMGVVVLLLEQLLAKAGIANDADVERLSEQLLGPLTKSSFGILTLGVAAALGEESIFRGALQPRFGLLLTTLLFALLHSTYGLSLATGIVFCVGLALGLIRQRANTTTSMLVHATYNISLGVMAALGLLQNI